MDNLFALFSELLTILFSYINSAFIRTRGGETYSLARVGLWSRWKKKETNWVDASELAFYFVVGCLAQSVEQLTLNQRVVGSSPTASTKNLRKNV